MLKNIKGQSFVEYVMLMIIVIGAFLTIQSYLKRGIQGRWRDSVDSLGEQYDPRVAISNVTHTLSSSTNTDIIAINATGGYFTRRTDTSSSTESQIGATTIGSY